MVAGKIGVGEEGVRVGFDWVVLGCIWGGCGFVTLIESTVRGFVSGSFQGVAEAVG